MSSTPFDSTAPVVLDSDAPQSLNASSAVIMALCAIENINPVEDDNRIDWLLHDVINPDALNDFIEHANGPETAITFTCSNYCIRVTGDKHITIQDCASLPNGEPS